MCNNKQIDPMFMDVTLSKLYNWLYLFSAATVPGSAAVFQIFQLDNRREGLVKQMTSSLGEECLPSEDNEDSCNVF